MSQILKLPVDQDKLLFFLNFANRSANTTGEKVLKKYSKKERIQLHLAACSRRSPVAPLICRSLIFTLQFSAAAFHDFFFFFSFYGYCLSHHIKKRFHL